MCAKQRRLMNIQGRLSGVISLRSSWLVVTLTHTHTREARRTPRLNHMIVWNSGGAADHEEAVWRQLGVVQREDTENGNRTGEKARRRRAESPGYYKDNSLLSV